MADIASLGIVVESRGITTAEQQLGRLASTGEKTAMRAKEIARAWGPALGAALAVGATAAGAAVLAWTRETTRIAGEFDRLAKLSNASVGDFQRQAAAARSVGIENGKLADIFKDVNDKVGEFLQTGGGELKDFFDNIAPRVGVTAEQFRKLSGPEALQLYVSSLEKAGVNQAEMVFYLEAIADEASALLPLLRNSGRGMREMGDEAERLGGVLDDQAVAASKALNSELWRLDQTFQGIKTQIAQQMVPVLTELSGELRLMAERGDLARNAADLLGSLLRGGVAVLREYENAVGRVSIAMGIFAESAAGLREIEANFGWGGLFDDGSIRDGWAKVNAAFEEGGRELDAHIARMNQRAMPGQVPGYLQLPGYLGGGALPGIGAPLESGGTPARPPRTGSGGGSRPAQANPADDFERIRAQLTEQIALFGQTGEAARLRYETEEGGLKRLAPAHKAELVALGEVLDFKQREKDATDESIQRAREEADARDRASQTVRNMLSNMKFELDLVGLSNEERAVSIALRHADAAATEEQRAEIAALARDIYKAREADSVLQDVKGAATDMFASFMDGSQSAGDAFEDFTKRLRRLAAQVLADKAMSYLMNMFGNMAWGDGQGANGTFSLYASGGYTGPGGVNQPAGIVHKGEIVWSQADIARAGGVGVVEAMRLGTRGYARGGVVGMAASGAGGGGIRDIVINTPPGTAARTEEQPVGDGSGMKDLVVFIENTSRNALSRDVATGTGFARTLEGAYGMRRAGAPRG